MSDNTVGQLPASAGPSTIDEVLEGLQMSVRPVDLQASTRSGCMCRLGSHRPLLSQ